MVEIAHRRQIKRSFPATGVLVSKKRVIWIEVVAHYPVDRFSQPHCGADFAELDEQAGFLLDVLYWLHVFPTTSSFGDGEFSMAIAIPSQWGGIPEQASTRRHRNASGRESGCAIAYQTGLAELGNDWDGITLPNR